MSVTLRDVAERAGVSIRTVSNVVNDFVHVAPATRARVQAALDELGYRPNLLARGLRQGRTGVVMLLVPDLTVPYFAELAHRVVEHAGPLGCSVLVDETGGEARRERDLLQLAERQGWIDGVLLSSLGLARRDLARLGTAVPMVLLGERTAGEQLDHVGIDNVAAAQAAVAHLVATGRTRVAAVGGRGGAADTTSRLRLRGYRRALHEAGLTPGPVVGTPDYSRAAGADAVAGLLAADPRPDAVFCLSDDLAAGVLRGAHDAGLHVPGDLAVVGFDDVDVSRFVVPSLTSVRPDRSGIARAALELLLRRRDGDRSPAQGVQVGFELVVRESTAPVAAPVP